MGYSYYVRDKWLNALRGGAFSVATLYASLHTGDPGDTGASEVTGGSPAYARKAITFGASSYGVIAATTTPQFDVPTSTTITHVGFWDALTAGNFLGGEAVTNEAFASQGTYTLSAATMDLNS